MSKDLSGKNLVELMAMLEPAPEPQAVSMVPATAGWFWLAVLVVAAIALLVRWWIARRRAGAYRKAALAELASAGSDPVAIAGIVRRTALAAYPRERVAQLHGEAWLNFLDESCGGRDFREGPGRAIASAPYATADAGADLAGAAKEWVRRHRANER